MGSTIPVGSSLVVDLAYYASANPQRFDVVLFEFPAEKPFYTVSRVIGMPGETVEVIGPRVRVNGKEISEPWMKSVANGQTNVPTSLVSKADLKEDEFFLMGDNRRAARDSRFIGPVTRKKIVGRVMAVNRQAETRRNPTVNVIEQGIAVVAYARSLPKGHRLETDDLKVIEIPEHRANPNKMILASKVESVVGARLLFAANVDRPVFRRELEQLGLSSF